MHLHLGGSQRGVELTLRVDVAADDSLGEQGVREFLAGEREDERRDDPVQLREQREPLVHPVHPDGDPVWIVVMWAAVVDGNWLVSFETIPSARACASSGCSACCSYHCHPKASK